AAGGQRAAHGVDGGFAAAYTLQPPGDGVQRVAGESGAGQAAGGLVAVGLVVVLLVAHVHGEDGQDVVAAAVHGAGREGVRLLAVGGRAAEEGAVEPHRGGRGSAAALGAQGDAALLAGAGEPAAVPGASGVEAVVVGEQHRERARGG